MGRFILETERIDGILIQDLEPEDDWEYGGYYPGTHELPFFESPVKSGIQAMTISDIKETKEFWEKVVVELPHDDVTPHPTPTLNIISLAVSRSWFDQLRQNLSRSERALSCQDFTLLSIFLSLIKAIGGEKIVQVLVRWKTTLGGDSMEAIKYGALLQGPSKYELCGISMKWKTKVDEAPQLGLSDFEDQV
ncbi:hypothetical protein B0O99DRAFT_709687 [Bisporella sp. PMI_857]|nr:hypothetical protein B0O99DRAFT_709687 [Bisporella sp. PMI_857]